MFELTTLISSYTNETNSHRLKLTLNRMPKEARAVIDLQRCSTGRIKLKKQNSMINMVVKAIEESVLKEILRGI
jgi:hypothetical protein